MADIKTESIEAALKHQLTAALLDKPRSPEIEMQLQIIMAITSGILLLHEDLQSMKTQIELIARSALKNASGGSDDN